MRDERPGALARPAFDLTVMVSCFNEQDSIVPTLKTLARGIREAGLRAEVIVMDDASSDRSAEVVQGHIDATPADPSVVLKLHRDTRNRGLQNNVFRCAALGHGEYYWVVAGDDNLTPDVYRSMLACLGKADIIIPNVLSYVGRTPQRRILSKAYVSIVNAISGQRIRYYNGSSIFRREHVLSRAGRTKGFGYSAEMILSLLDEGATYLEVEVTYNERQSGVSTAVNLRNFIDVGRFFIRALARRVRRALWSDSR